MKKFVAKNRNLLLAGAGLLLVTIMVFSVKLIPSSNAKYVSDIPEGDPFDTGISAISNSDLDNLLRLMMNERYPVGSIYMTADPAMNTPAKMASHFGGAWSVFAAEKVPVGYAATGFNDYFNAVPKSGGNSIGGGTGNNADISIIGAVTGNLALTNGGGTWKTRGSFSLGSTYFKLKYNGPATMTTTIGALTWVSHNHTISPYYAAGGVNQKAGGSCCPASGTAKVVSAQSTSSSGNSNVTVGSVGGGTGPTFTSGIPDLTNAPKYTPPPYTYIHPEWVEPQPQQKIAGALDFDYDATKGLKVDDKTLQPYVIVFMYKRDALAPVPPLP